MYELFLKVFLATGIVGIIAYFLVKKQEKEIDNEQRIEEINYFFDIVDKTMCGKDHTDNIWYFPNGQILNDTLKEHVLCSEEDVFNFNNDKDFFVIIKHDEYETIIFELKKDR